MQETRSKKKIRIFISLLLCFSASFLFTACSLNKSQNEKVVRLGYMPNVTHATALVGIEKDFFQEELGDKIKFKPIHFVVGNSIIDAFITNQIDVAYVGPGPFINAVYRKIPIKLLANAANGGTLIVGAIHALKPDIRIAVPQYGNTQDLILRLFLEKNKLIDKVKIIAIPPQDTATTFFTRSIDAACLPEPWGTILIGKKADASGKDTVKLLVDEKAILNSGNYPVTFLVVNEKYLRKNPDVINKVLSAHKKSNEFIVKYPGKVAEIVTQAIKNISKKQVDQTIIAKSLARCNFKDEIDLNILKGFTVIGVKSGYYKDIFLKRRDVPWYVSNAN